MEDLKLKANRIEICISSTITRTLKQKNKDSKDLKIIKRLKKELEKIIDQIDDYKRIRNFDDLEKPPIKMKKVVQTKEIVKPKKSNKKIRNKPIQGAMF